MNSKQIKNMVMTATILALTIVFQYIRLLIGTNEVSTYIIATLVNTCLIIAALLLNIYSGLAVAILAPLVALLQGFAQAPMLPWLVAGNVVLVITYAIFIKKGKRPLARYIIVGAVAAVVKYIVITFGQATVLSGKGQVFNVAFNTAMLAQLKQLITAMLAICTSFLVLKPLEKAISKN